jgi:hypothetical protein
LAEVGVRLVQVHDAGGGRGRVRVPSRSIQIRLDPQVAVATRGRPARSLAGEDALLARDSSRPS